MVKNRLTEAEEKMEALGSEEWSMWYGSVKEGGSYQPEDCQPSQKVAIIVPYRYHYNVIMTIHIAFMSNVFF